MPLKTNFVHSEHSLTPDDQLCQDHGSRVFEYIRDAALNNRPGALKSGGIANLQTLDSLKNKASNIISKREAKAAEKADAANVSSDDEPAGPTVLAAPSLGSIASQQPPVATKKRAAKKKLTKEREDSPGADVVSMVSGQGASSVGKKSKDKEFSAADLAVVNQMKQQDPELHQVVKRLGYVPDCFEKLHLSKMFGSKLGRSIHQAR